MMKKLFPILVCVPALAALYFAYSLALNQREGWGWFLFLAVICSPKRIQIDNNDTAE
jgi:hypothetical protein